MNMALTPLAFPTIVTPYGIAALVVFVAICSDPPSRLTIGAIVLAITLLNLIVMIMTAYIRPLLGAALAILGAVLGVVQVALGLQIINNSLKVLGSCETARGLRSVHIRQPVHPNDRGHGRCGAGGA